MVATEVAGLGEGAEAVQGWAGGAVGWVEEACIGGRLNRRSTLLIRASLPASICCKAADGAVRSQAHTWTGR